MLDQLIIRKATLNDLKALLRIEQGIINAERQYDKTIKPGQIRYYDLESMLQSPDVEIVVGEYKEEIIASGYARLQKSQPYLAHEQHAYMGFMYVHPDYRGRGVIQKIMDALKKWTAAQGLTEMRLEVYFNNESAIKAYEKLGFTKHIIEMRMAL